MFSTDIGARLGRFSAKREQMPGCWRFLTHAIFRQRRIIFSCSRRERGDCICARTCVSFWHWMSLWNLALEGGLATMYYLRQLVIPISNIVG